MLRHPLIEKYGIEPSSVLAAAVRRGIYDEAAVRRFLPKTLVKRVDARERAAQRLLSTT